MKKILVTLVCLALILSLSLTSSAKKVKKAPVAKPLPLSEQSEACIACHENFTPGIVDDWRTSRHSKTTPGEALEKPKLEKRVSSKDIPEIFRSTVVGCFECHGQNPEAHADNFDHMGFKINVVVSPNDCRTCHATEVEEYQKSKKGNAIDNLEKNPVYHTLVETILSVKETRDADIKQLKSSDSTRGEACFGCHGTRVGVDGMKTVETELGEIEVPNLTNWPNMGVGRQNPDGSLGSCTACHPRHGFSIEVARKPYTCAQCHLQPDVPGWEIFKESKHGNIFFSKGANWNYTNVPWKPGKDFNAPTCATCHMSLLTKGNDEVIAERTHNMGDRLWVRLFGLIYSAPQPKEGATYNIKNKDGLPMPTSFDGQFASEYLIDEAEQKRRKGNMIKICNSCHSTDWANGHFDQMDVSIKETNDMTLAATKLLDYAWKNGLVDPANPFDEALEQMWIKQWLFYATSIRYASAMSGPDYVAFKNGWWELNRNLQEMRDIIDLKAKSNTGKKKSKKKNKDK